MDEEGPGFLSWLADNRVLRAKIAVPAEAVTELLRAEVDTEDAARQFWGGVPRALSHACPETMHEAFGVVRAYLWLHFLERYARTWGVLEYLVKQRRLPMGRHGVRTLDVGAGLGPAAFAIHDFYAAMLEFAEETNHPGWHQPPEITCVERAGGFSAMRAHLWEMTHVVSGGDWPSRFSRWKDLADVMDIRPVQERADEFERLRWSETTYWDEIRDEEASELVYLPQEANRLSQSLHRYRLFVFANFFTSRDSAGEMSEKLTELLIDAEPGSVLLIMGAQAGDYPAIYNDLEQIVLATGSWIVVPEARTSSETSSVDDIVCAQSLRVYDHVQNLARSDDPTIVELGTKFAQGAVFKANAVRTFRKHRHVKPG